MKVIETISNFCATIQPVFVLILLYDIIKFNQDMLKRSDYPNNDGNNT